MNYNLGIIFFTFYCIHINLCLGNNWHFSLSSMYDIFNFELDQVTLTEKYIRNEYKILNDIKR